MHAKKELDDLQAVVKDKNALSTLKELSELITAVSENRAIHDLASRIGNVNVTFHGLRKAFHLPEKGKLSENTRDDEISHENCNTFIGQLREIVKSGCTQEMDTAKQIISAYEKWEKHLFAQNKERTVPRTNNSLEQFFRMIRRNVRKRTGNLATGRLLSRNGDKLALFQNLGILDYVKQIFGSTNIADKFAGYRKGLRKDMIQPMMICPP